MIRLRQSVHDEMVAHAIAGVPNEACGLFVADATAAEIPEVHGFYPMTNVANSWKIYKLDPQEMLDVERQADQAGHLIVGVMHSHTLSEAYPSPTDVADATAFDPFGTWHFIIVSLKETEPRLRSFRIVDQEITEEEVALV